MTDVYELTQGHLPILISMPHVGTELFPSMSGCLTPAALQLPDTDWYIDKLYARVLRTGVSVIRANYSRYIVDLNRPANDETLYPGQATTSLCPTRTFHQEPIYFKGKEPDEHERAQRLAQYWQPYHDAIGKELSRMRRIHSKVVLWDAHSICSRLPAFFDGRLPDLNIGTNKGLSCARELEDALEQAARKTPFSYVVNGRYTGGYITRNYGRPDTGVHAVQLEMAQAAYMNEAAPYVWDEQQAEMMSKTVAKLVETAGRFILNDNS